ncbi:unnamed protein product [Rangifer tarandus platyrhynchus]|uniref:Uncharacterized protein n=1 Tax=Rangifer tarandus platyrhynchus TaxID=3082113 RepID=A0ABN8Y916_RANTA|nr:unnamed protein product [Rangifer tarandus platyrhynchus]
MEGNSWQEFLMFTLKGSCRQHLIFLSSAGLTGTPEQQRELGRLGAAPKYRVISVAPPADSDWHATLRLPEVPPPPRSLLGVVVNFSAFREL